MAQSERPIRFITHRILLASGGPGPVHIRLQRAIEQFISIDNLVPWDGTLAPNRNPDVVRMQLVSRDKRLLFIGDAKDSKNELPSHKKSADQIKDFLDGFLSRIQAGEFDGGGFVIATDQQEAANQWAQALNGWCSAYEPLFDEQNRPMCFQVGSSDTDTWFAYFGPTL